MKVLIVSEYFAPEIRGGGELSALALAKALHEKGVDVSVLTSTFFMSVKEEYEGITVHRLLKTGKDPSKITDNIKRKLYFDKSLQTSLLNLIKNEDYDIIHCMNITSISAVRVKNKIKKNFILHVNSPVLFCPKGTMITDSGALCENGCNIVTYAKCYTGSDSLGKMQSSLILRYNPLAMYGVRKAYDTYTSLLDKFDAYLPISNYMHDMLVKRGIPKEKITIVYNIMDLTLFRSLKPVSNPVPKILYLGPLTEHKGPQILISALKQLTCNYEANFYGEGNLRQILDMEVKRSKLHVTLNNEIPYSQVSQVMQRHDIVVIPSVVAEALSRSALEACAAGKTVIASNIGGIPDIVVDDVTGYLFRPGDSADLAKKLEKVILTGFQPHRESADAILKNFDKDLIVKEVISTYNGVLNGRTN